jgi:hypothetical protein
MRNAKQQSAISGQLSAFSFAEGLRLIADGSFLTMEA